MSLPCHFPDFPISPNATQASPNYGSPLLPTPKSHHSPDKLTSCSKLLSDPHTAPHPTTASHGCHLTFQLLLSPLILPHADDRGLRHFKNPTLLLPRPNLSQFATDSAIKINWIQGPDNLLAVPTPAPRPPFQPQGLILDPQSQDVHAGMLTSSSLGRSPGTERSPWAPHTLPS